jgi:hypothetical protein
MKFFPVTTRRDTQSMPELTFEERLSSKKYLNTACHLTVKTQTVATTPTSQLVL